MQKCQLSDCLGAMPGPMLSLPMELTQMHVGLALVAH